MHNKPTSRHIILVGFMGTGKSTIAKLLAERLAYPRLDLDQAIEQRTKRKIADIFATDGEEVFRFIETTTLAETLQNPQPLVIATGGGAVLAEQNRTLMLEHGIVIALTATEEQIISRVASDTARPLIQGDVRARVRQLLEQRKDAYRFAHLTIDTTQLQPREVTQQIVQFVETL